MFISALGSITGRDNRLSLPKVRSAAVIMVDGLGSGNIRQAAGHAPYLNSLLAKSPSLATVFPSTTAAALTSFGTGLLPGEHGILGYSVLDRQSNKPLNMLSGWGGDAVPEQWQERPTIAIEAADQGVEVAFVGPAEYKDSGFTRVFMRGSQYCPAKTIDDRLSETHRLLANRQSTLVYCYLPELDQIAHAHGVDSTRWLAAIESLNADLSAFAARVPKDSGVLLTADHGVVDVPATNHIFLDDFIQNGLVSVTGDPRCQFLYLSDDSNADDVVNLLNSNLNNRAIALTRKQVIELGLYGEIIDLGIERRMPEVFVVATKNCALYHRQFAPVKSLNMVGQHGGISDLELMVPLLKLGGYA